MPANLLFGAARLFCLVLLHADTRTSPRGTKPFFILLEKGLVGSLFGTTELFLRFPLPLVLNFLFQKQILTSDGNLHVICRECRTIWLIDLIKELSFCFFCLCLCLITYHWIGNISPFFSFFLSFFSCSFSSWWGNCDAQQHLTK